MSDLMEENLDFLNVLGKAKPIQCKALLSHISHVQFKAVITLLHNIIVGIIPVTDLEKKTLYRYRTSIRLLTSRRVGHKPKKELLLSCHSILPTCVRALERYWSSTGDNDETYGTAVSSNLRETSTDSTGEDEYRGKEREDEWRNERLPPSSPSSSDPEGGESVTRETHGETEDNNASTRC